MEDLHDDILGVWSDRATSVRRRSIDCGHHMAEEAPQDLAAELKAFFNWVSDNLDC
jgi:haloacetate dehalogenase